MSDSDSDDLIAQQAMMASAKYGGVGKTTAVLHEDKKKFDSADYYQKQAQVMKAAGMEVDGEAEAEEKKDEAD
ncbi:unnamed protein product [Moneuplotes crassus]|uniref:Uncharacterized protein n=1 Tax=Euplotes crassus TaxID=5936 RepID=A0AAD1XSZ0_EUPCR|nr:unnamed protein product [Moneuplotes crassus]CAI2378294.1 unnamed protein product [Moneuplotes crassus]